MKNLNNFFVKQKKLQKALRKNKFQNDTVCETKRVIFETL